MGVFALGDQVPDIHPDAYVHPDATVIGNVTIGPESSVWPAAVLRGDEGEIRIGARTSIQDGSVIHTIEEIPTVIGDDVTVGHLVHIEGANIADHCLIGSGSTVLPGTEIGSGSLVGAESLVTPGTKAPAGSFMIGSPARVVEKPVPAEALEEPVRSYRARAKRFAAELRPLDYEPGRSIHPDPQGAQNGD